MPAVRTGVGEVAEFEAHHLQDLRYDGIAAIADRSAESPHQVMIELAE